MIPRKPLLRPALSAAIVITLWTAVLTAADWPAYEPGPRANATCKGRATGFFHVERIDATWWTIDPLGNAFFILGTDHANYGAHWCETLGYAPYHRKCEKLYGDETKWAESTLTRLKAWGFNSLGVNPSASLLHQNLPHPEFLSLGAEFAAIDAITTKTTWTGFPNVFSPEWPAFCDKRAGRLCTPRKNDPWVLGYFFDNELEWHPNTGGGLFADTFKKPAGHSAKRALIELLTRRHATPADFNRAWGTTIAAFDDLAAMTATPNVRSDAARADVTQFIRLVAERYFSVAAAAVRKHDPNHMLLGCRFAGSAPEVVDIAGRYSDIFSINCYRNVDLRRGVMADSFEEDLRRWHEQSGRPMMITEWSFPAMDTGLPCKHGAGQRVPTQADRAFCFTVFQKLLLSTPFMVGSNYFMWVDEPAPGISKTFPEDSNYGLVNEDDRPYEALTGAATRLHALADAIHGGRMTDVYVKAPDGDGPLAIGNAGAVAARAKVTAWTDGCSETRQLDLPVGAEQPWSPPADSLARSGGHLVACLAEVENPLLQKTAGRAFAFRLSYSAGTPWPDGLKWRVPLVVANPTDEPLEPGTLTVKLGDVLGNPAPGIWQNLAVLDDSSHAVPAQVDDLEDGTELAVALGSLTPRAARTLLIGPIIRSPAARPAVEYRRTPTGFEVHNGPLTLVKDDPKSGNAFDHIRLNGLEMGRFSPVLHQDAGQNVWVQPQRVEPRGWCSI